MHQNLLQFRGGRYLWMGLALLVFSLILYWTQAEDLPPNGGSWQGYTLGGLGAALIIWLSLLGIRKRTYRSRMGTVEGWASAHVYFGTALLVVATLHTGFQFGWNVHTLFYVLMAAVIVSGFFGLFVYLVYPRRLARVRAGRRRKEWLSELNAIDARIRDLAQRCDARTRAAAESAIDRTSLGGGVFAQLRGTDRSLVLEPEKAATSPKLVSNHDQNVVIDHLATAIPKAGKRDEALVLQELLTVFGRRRTVLRKLREDIRLQAWLQVWLYVHIPLTIAVLGALVVHVATVFMYW